MQEALDYIVTIDPLDEAGQHSVDILINRTTDLKQLPVLARKIMQVIENPRSTAQDLERVIRSDQSLTVKLLKIANSSFYGLLRKVNTLQRAILVVGFKAIKDIAVSTAILNMYRSTDPYSLKLWEHGVAAGIISRIISLEVGATETEEAFVSGLLHDLGRVLMHRQHPVEIRRIQEALERVPTADPVQIERQVFGFNHTHAGGQLVRIWNLSPTLEGVVRAHHSPNEVIQSSLPEDWKRIILIVGLSNRICRRLGIGYDHPDPTYDIFNTPENRVLGVGEGRLNDLVEESRLAFMAESQIFA